MSKINYDSDVLAWANEQADLIRARQFDQLDWEHIAEEIEDVGKSERRELAHRMALLIAHLLKWQYQPERQCNSWRRTIREQRRAIALRLKKVPSLKSQLADPDWQEAIWADAVTIAIGETGLAGFPDNIPWKMDEILANDWQPLVPAE